MYRIDTFMNDQMLVDGRLIVNQNTTIAQIVELVEEMKSIDSRYTILFSLDAFSKYRNLPDCLASHIKNMTVGVKCGFGDIEVTKLSKSICIGELMNIRVQYNDCGSIPITKVNPRAAEDKKIQLLCG